MQGDSRSAPARRKQQIKWALGGFHIPDEYHGNWKDDPLYVPGEPISLVDLLPSIKGVDPTSHALFDQFVETAAVGVEKALYEQSTRIARPAEIEGG